jgi:hypothetical protein
VHISHQPAFDHPFLKNHTIQVHKSVSGLRQWQPRIFVGLLQSMLFRSLQMMPNYHPDGLYDESKSNVASSTEEKPKVQLWHQNGRCPKDTIPIRRTKKDDLLRASSLGRYGRKRHTTANPLSVSPTMLNEGGHQVRAHMSYCLVDVEHGIEEFEVL